MYECTECGNISSSDYKCCELCGNDEWVMYDDAIQAGDPVIIKLNNGNRIEAITSKNNIIGRRAKYFKQINDYINSLSDEEFDILLIECGINSCPNEEWEMV